MVTSEVLASATYKTTYVAEMTDGGGDIVSLTYVDVYIPTDLYSATTADDVSSYVSQCIDPRAVSDVNIGLTTMACTPGPDEPATGCPVPTLFAAASSTTPPLIDTSALFSTISSAEASATGGKKNDAVQNVGGRGTGHYWLSFYSRYSC